MLDFNRYYQQVFNIGYRSSAISPLLWLNALIGAPCFMSSYIIESSFRYAPFSLGVCLPIYTLYMYSKLLNINPRLVQSEKFQIEMQKLDIIAEKGGNIVFDPMSIPLSEDPKQLPEPQRDD